MVEVEYLALLKTRQGYAASCLFGPNTNTIDLNCEVFKYLYASSINRERFQNRKKKKKNSFGWVLSSR